MPQARVEPFSMMGLDLARAFLVGLTFGGLLQVLGWMPRLTPADERVPSTSYLLLVLTTWAGSVWLRPEGTSTFGSAEIDAAWWWVFALSGAFAALAVAIMCVPRKVRLRLRSSGRIVQQERPPTLLPTNFVGAVLLCLAFAISARYVVG